MRVVIYVRVSTGHQVEDAKSLESQEHLCRSYASVRELEVLEVISDGASAKSLNRPGWKRVEALLEAGEAQGVLVYKLDRLTRSVRDCCDLVERFNDVGWSLYSAADSLDPSTPSGRCMINIMASFAQWNREEISVRTKAALARKREAGMRLGGVPVGHRGVGGGKLERTERYVLVERAVALRAEGLTLKMIAECMNAEGFRTSRGGRLYHPAVRRLLNAANVEGAA